MVCRSPSFVWFESSSLRRTSPRGADDRRARRSRAARCHESRDDIGGATGDRRQVGSVDVLVNNAALLLGETDDVLTMSADDYRRTFETNLFGIVEVCRAFVPPMARARYGRVVNVSSGAGQLATMSL
jgi:NAD(P)-dependent dehydrogenase (short-subunit alcohol dehydrogenase family)